MRKHIIPFLLAAFPYLFVLLGLIPEEWIQALESQMVAFLSNLGAEEAYTRFISMIGLVLSALSAALFLAMALYPLLNKSLTTLELARWNLIIKAAHIPLYVLVFLVCLLLLLAIAAPAVLMMALIMIPGMFVFDLLLMLTSSCYGFRALRKACQEGLVDKKWAIRHTILHCVFVADVISAFLVWKRLRSRRT